MKKFVAIAGVVSLVSTTAAVAREEPTIEINIDVLQGLVPPPAPAPSYVPSVQKLPSELKAPCKKPKATTHKKSVRKKKSPAPVKEIKQEPVATIVEPITPAAKEPVKPEIPTIAPAPLPTTTPVEAPKAETKPAEAPKVDEKAPAIAETPKADAPVEAPKTAEPTPPAAEAPKAEEKPMDEWLLKAGELRDKFKQWAADKKEALFPTPAPEPEKQAEVKAVEDKIPAVPATDIAAQNEPKTNNTDVAPAANPAVDKALANAAKEPVIPTVADKAPVVVAPVEIKPAVKEEAPAKPEKIKPGEKQAIAAPTPVVTEKAEPVKQPEPFTVPAEEPAKPTEAQKPAAPAEPAQPHIEAKRLQTEVDELLLKADALKNRFKAWVKTMLETTPATVTLPKAEEKILPDASAISDTASTEPSPAPHASDLAKPEAETKPTTPAPTPAAEPNTVITPPAAPAGIRPAAAGALQHKADSNLLYTVLFAGGGDEVAEADMAPLNALAEKLQQEKDTRISVLGSAPRMEGSQESDARKLSLKRAIAVRQLLIKQGIRSDRINVRALGSDTKEVVKDRVDIVKLR